MAGIWIFMLYLQYETNAGAGYSRSAAG